MKKIILAIFLWFAIFNSSVFAQETLITSFDKAIDDSSLSKKSIIAVSIREVDSEKVVYEKNSQLLLHPASTLKAFTTPVALKTLGKDYKIATNLYQSTKDENLYLKLSADPFLTSNDLIEMFKTVKNNGINIIKGSIIIDDSIIDNKYWGKGWMWDDNNEASIPKFSSYNLDHNLFKVKISPAQKDLPPDVVVDLPYEVNILNIAKTSSLDNITVEKHNYGNSEDIDVLGEIKTPVEIYIPIENTQKYFIENLKKAIRINNIQFDGDVKVGKIPQDSFLIYKTEHNLADEVEQINHKSDNMGAETLFKLAGAEYTHSQGSTEAGFMAFKTFYASLGLNVDCLKLVDASGVSHYNLMQSDWMSLALCKLFKTNFSDVYINSLAQPEKCGTLENRLKNIPFKVRAKTGTLSGISAITGYIQPSSGKTYSFVILIQNFNCESKCAKELEDKIINIMGNSI